MDVELAEVGVADKARGRGRVEMEREEGCEGAFEGGGVLEFDENKKRLVIEGVVVIGEHELGF